MKRLEFTILKTFSLPSSSTLLQIPDDDDDDDDFLTFLVILFVMKFLWIKIYIFKTVQ